MSNTILVFWVPIVIPASRGGPLLLRLAVLVQGNEVSVSRPGWALRENWRSGTKQASSFLCASILVAAAPTLTIRCQESIHPTNQELQLRTPDC